MRARSVMTFLMVLLVLSNCAFADTIVLKSGTRYSGSVANRDLVKANPVQQQSVGLLIQGTGELKRFPVSEIDFVILDDEGKEQVIDFRGLQGGQTVKRTEARKTNGISDDRAFLLLIGGTGIAFIGVIEKFGGAKATITENSMDVDEHSYNGLNYVMMVGGVVLAVIGVVMLSSGPQRSSSFDRENGLFVCCRPDHRNSELRVGYNFVF